MSRHKGYKHTKETKQKISKANKGKPFSEEHKRKLGLAMKGKPSGMLGKHHSDKLKQKLSLSNHIHHIDLNQENNLESNILKLNVKVHISLHRQSYNYLVETGQIQNYTIWFLNKLNKERGV
jgi:hypothetical protein